MDGKYLIVQHPKGVINKCHNAGTFALAFVPIEADQSPVKAYELPANTVRCTCSAALTYVPDTTIYSSASEALPEYRRL
jgi:hypothetical protein